MSTETSREEGRDPQRFSRVLNTLFATRRKREADGREKPYTLREVAQGSGISIGYLSEARRGNIENPSLDKIELLARFFGVHPNIFLEGNVEENVEADLPPALREALSEPLMRQIVLRAGAYSAVERAMILEIMDKVEQWGTGLAAREKEAEQLRQKKLADPER